jgi:hypothetical protein
LRRQPVDDGGKHPRKLVKEGMTGHARLPREFVNLLGAKGMAELIRLDRFVRTGTYP